MRLKLVKNFSYVLLFFYNTVGCFHCKLNKFDLKGNLWLNKLQISLNEKEKEF